MKFEVVRGMRDFVGEKARKKQFIEDTCRRIFERYGFEPLQSPVLEDFSLLAAKNSAGEAIREEIYYFKDKGDRELGLRFDFTVPLARIVASDTALQKPFKRYCIGAVYRYDRPGAKRYREFTQADVDIVGPKSILADYECVRVAADVMRSLGLDFRIKANNRMVLEELAKKCGVREEQVKDAMRSIDKLGKIGKEGVRKELESKEIADEILEKTEVNSLSQVKDALGEAECVKELEMLLELGKLDGIPELCFDLSLVRGLEYYTGNVFEVSLSEGPSVGGGGRYDRLIEVYGGNPTPAVGISFGIDRLLDNLESAISLSAPADIYIATLSEAQGGEAMKIAGRLRKAGLSVESDLMGRNLKKSLEYANRKGVPFVVVLGENELKSGRVKVKEMSSGEEKEFDLGDVKGIAEFCGK